MGVSITSHDWPEDKFTELLALFPTGRYDQAEDCHWFKVYVTTDAGIVELIWFKER